LGKRLFAENRWLMGAAFAAHLISGSVKAFGGLAAPFVRDEEAAGSDCHAVAQQGHENNASKGIAIG
jgi:hypothetical protein